MITKMADTRKTGTPACLLDWNVIDSVFLDMDGTLLDLHYDNHFWREHVPLRYAEQHDMSIVDAKAELIPRFSRVAGTMQWYCLDYWTRELGLDIAGLKRETAHLIALREHVIDFLGAVRAAGKSLLLVTNAHERSLALKMQHMPLRGYFDALICAHDFRAPKEDQLFWENFALQQPFMRDRTLLIDDSLPVLRSAQRFGIGHLLAVCKPDSRQPECKQTEFPALDSFLQIMPGT